jgi:hypothetical protein
MAEVIPRLRDLCFRRNSYQVPNGFAGDFVKLHAYDWRAAQVHWERIVERVLCTDAVEADATGWRAMHQAVAGAAILLERTDLRDRCPLCTVNDRKGRRG